MKLLIYNDKKQEKEKEIYLKLVEGKDGIGVVTCDKEGEPMWYLCEISQAGIYLSGGIPDYMGFTLNKYGQLRVL